MGQSAAQRVRYCGGSGVNALGIRILQEPELAWIELALRLLPEARPNMPDACKVEIEELRVLFNGHPTVRVSEIGDRTWFADWAPACLSPRA